jgi:hypothetical protein
VRRGGDAVDRGERREEPPLLTLEHRLVRRQLEDGRHEVLARRVLFEAADEVADGDVELTGVHDRGVEQQAADVVLDEFGLPLGHAEQHLELDAVAHPAGLGQQVRERDVEEVVTGDADAHGAGAVGGESPGEDPLVVRVAVLLRAVGRERPLVHGRVDGLHREVGALDHAHLDRGPSGVDPGRGPVGEPLQGAEGVGQVGLQHDAGLEAAQLRLVEEAREDRDRQVEVAVLLHVEVDELRLRRAGGQLVERGQLLDDALDGLVEGPHRELTDDRRDLDRHVVDVVAGQQGPGAREPVLGLGAAEHGLAEQVQVQARPVSSDRGDGGAELGGPGVGDEVTDHAAQHATGDGHDDAGQHGGHDAAEPDGRPHVPGQERGDLRGQGREVARGDAEVLRADDAVDEPDGEGETRLVLQHLGEQMRRAGARGARGLVGPAAGEGDGVVADADGQELFSGGRPRRLVEGGHGMNVGRNLPGGKV